MNALGPPGICGVWPALMTPLREDASIDLPRFTSHAQALLAAGCGGVTPFGTTGEGPSFSVDERRAAVDALVAAGVPASRILVSVSCAALPDTMALARHAQGIGAWGILLMPPFFFKGVPDAGIVDAMSQVIAALDARPLRVVLYHIPQVAAVGLSQPVIAELLRRHAPRIVAIKDSQCDRAHSLALADAFMQADQPAIGVHVGNELDLPALAARGSRGAVSGVANFMPRTVHRLAIEPVAAHTATEHARVERLLGWLGGYALIPALKAIMAAQTGARGWLRVRAPLQALDATQFAAFSNQLVAHRLDPSTD